MSILALPELPQLTGVLPDANQSGSSATVPYSQGGPPQTPAEQRMERFMQSHGNYSGSSGWWNDLPRIGTFLLGFLLIAGAIFAPRDIKSAATTAAKAAVL